MDLSSMGLARPLHCASILLCPSTNRSDRGAHRQARLGQGVLDARGHLRQKTAARYEAVPFEITQAPS